MAANPYSLRSRRWPAFLIPASLLFTLWAQQPPATRVESAESPDEVTSKVDFEKEIFPIFEASCFTCHGPEQQQAQYRLDSKTVAFQGGVAGPPILPGNAEQSALYRRVAGVEGVNPMPLVGDRLSAEQIELIRAWIDQGADWPDDVGVQAGRVAKHWAYVKPERREPPQVRNATWVRNSIDHFVLARLEKEGLEPNPEASRETLIRRLSLDLLGLPPDVKEVKAFVADRSPNAYESLVDRLLQSPRYGEHWAQYWLDLARYADTNGYESDEPRTMWAYRDWVVDAFNRNLPFDRFTIEQLAGDLLPNPTEDQLIATGFHRNTLINNEAGSKDDEFYDAAVKDRVDTTATVWLGSTLGCAQCHDHKYDPFSQKEYYRFYAIFNNTTDSGIELSDELPVFKGDRAELRRRQEAVQQVKAILDTPTPELEAAQRDWEARLQPRLSDFEQAWQPLEPSKVGSAKGSSLVRRPDGSVVAGGENPGQDIYELEFKTSRAGITGLRLEVLSDPSLPSGGPGRGENGSFFLTGVEAAAWTSEQLEEQSASAQKAPKWEPWHTIGPFRVTSREEAFATIHGPEENYDLLQIYEEGNLAWAKRSDWRDGVVHDFEGDYSASFALRTVTVPEPTTVWVSLGSDKGIELWLNRKKVFSDDPTREVKADQEVLKLDLTAGKNEILLKLTNDTGRYGFYFQPLTRLEKAARVRFASAWADQGQSENEDVSALFEGRADRGWQFNAEKADAGGQVYAMLQAATPFGSPEGVTLKLRLYHDSKTPGGSLGRFRVSATTLDPDALAQLLRTPARIQAILAMGAAGRSGEQRRELAAYYRSIAPALETARQKYQDLKARLEAFREKHTTTTLVLRERTQPRKTYVQNRGNFLDLGERVEPGAPRVLGSINGAGPINRLRLAQWLVDDENPLTARVRVNQIWGNLFGRGLILTSEDFGSQGNLPSHPKLLDWLATEFMRLGWDQKAFLKTIVMSATYRQSSKVSPEKLEKDPANELLSRGARFRVRGESVRDVALRIGGLLSGKIGGPSVFPPQPDSVLNDRFIEGGFRLWRTAQDEDRFRRALYTFYKRTVVYPTLMTFDAPDRTVCVVKRPRSNTPLQALNTLNDPAFFEAAGGLALRILEDVQSGPPGRIEYGFRRALARSPSQQEAAEMLAFYESLENHYRQSEEEARRTVASAYPGPAPEIAAGELAPWIVVSNVLLNLDETITRE